MRNIPEFVDQQLTWIQRHPLKREYVLRATDEVVASLRFKNLFSRFATGESADGCWTFKRERVGFMGSTVIVRACGTGATIAVFKDDSGTLELADGRRIVAAINLWQTQLTFQTAAGEVLFRFKKRGIPWFFYRLRATGHIARAAVGTAELPWMVMLGWYLMVTMIEASISG